MHASPISHIQSASSHGDDDVLVRVENVSKIFCRDFKKSLFYGLKDSARDLISWGNPDPQSGENVYSEGYQKSRIGQPESTNHQSSGTKHQARPLRPGEFYAVNNVSFELRRGECIGLIGHNGAGKTTLLKMLNGLIKPDSGRIEMRGRIGALIALGAGFNPLLTGRENIYVNASVLGFRRSEIDERIDKIIEFAEISEFIDAPVQTYSSGMQVRLGFAIAIKLEPDVLLVDEVLAVGDIGFRVKCYNEIYRIINKTAIILVSHSMPQIGKVCNMGVVMDKGRIKCTSNNIGEAIRAYYDLFESEEKSTEGSQLAEIFEIQFGEIERPCSIINPCYSKAPETIVTRINKPSFFSILYSLDASILDHLILLTITDSDQKIISQSSSKIVQNKGKNTALKATTEIALMLNNGNYTLSVHLIKVSSRNQWDGIILGIRNAIRFTVERGSYSGAAPVLYDSKWNYL